ncbi:TIR domain-containing protein [Robertmurraya beringensis]|uniref:TIR domain-containing protein n=1 Tax=Robertmurraya beringensis TaxID=641660 RepID=A0ABV6KTD0_9BACI
MSSIKPKVFIGSASESLEYVDAIHEGLGRIAEVTPWSTGVFKATEYTIESLERQLDQNDFAVFVFSPDDIVNIRGNISYTTRDNTLFEMGLFWGRLRRGRVFYIIPTEVPSNENAKGIRLPTDLDGITVLHYEKRTDGNYDAAVNRACRSIKRAIEEKGPFLDPGKLLAELNNEREQEYTLIRVLRTLSKRLLFDSSQPLEYLTEAVRNGYKAPENFYVEGTGVWKPIGTDGLKQVAGNEGQGEFFNFNVNHGKNLNDPDRIVVVDCFQQSEELVFEKTTSHYDNTYVLCYPIRNKLVLTVALTGRPTLSKDEIDQIFLDNYSLLDTINKIYGGATL